MMVNTKTEGDKVLWSELLPCEFKSRLEQCPIVYLPLGICEPHGQISALGLDTIKAEYLCIETARSVGGIVAPSLGYQIHESGYHAAWLEEEVGEENPHMTAIPPFVYLHFFLYQLRAFVNAGFKGIVVLTGHSGGNQDDLRKVAESFSKDIPVRIWIGSDPELVEGKFHGDHAGKYEISQLMYLRPELIDFTKVKLQDVKGSGGKLALGSDAFEATSEFGEMIMKSCLASLISLAREMHKDCSALTPIRKIGYDYIEMLWRESLRSWSTWKTLSPWPNQNAVSEGSQWKQYELPSLNY